jgi:hypothetical protein
VTVAARYDQVRALVAGQPDKLMRICLQHMDAHFSPAFRPMHLQVVCDVAKSPPGSFLLGRCTDFDDRHVCGGGKERKRIPHCNTGFSCVLPANDNSVGPQLRDMLGNKKGWAPPAVLVPPDQLFKLRLWLRGEPFTAIRRGHRSIALS